MRKYTIIIPLVFLVIIGAVFAKKGSTPVQENDKEQPAHAMDMETERLPFVIQPVGETQITSYGYQDPTLDIDVWAYFKEPGFVVISKKGDKDILNASSLQEDETDQITLAVEGKLSYGDHVLAVLYKDDGDGNFDINKDIPFKDTSDKPVVVEILLVHPM